MFIVLEYWLFSPAAVQTSYLEDRLVCTSLLSLIKPKISLLLASFPVSNFSIKINIDAEMMEDTRDRRGSRPGVLARREQLASNAA
jgi:hypothetical protein